MPVRSPGFFPSATDRPAVNGTGRSRTAAAYQVMPEANRNVSGYEAREIDAMVRGDTDADGELAWYFYARIPELRYVARYIANSLSMATLYIAEPGDDPSHPTKIGSRHPANDLLDSWAGGQSGQSQLLDRLGLALTLPGDAIVAGPENGALKFPFDQWRVFSASEITSRNGALWYRSAGSREEPVPTGVRAVRIWRPHPRLWWEADSPTRSSYVVLREIDYLDQHVQATCVSRLAGAGVWLIPEEFTLPTDIGGDDLNDQQRTDTFSAWLSEVMAIAIKNRESAAAIVPIILRGPAEFLAAFQKVDFSTAFDERVPELRNVALHRLALGMDVPPEIMMGTSGTSHWGSWQVEDSTLRVHTHPLLKLICASLTEGWLQPALKDLPLSDAQRAKAGELTIWYDTSALTIQPNISEESAALYDRFEIGPRSLRSHTGFSPADAPTKDELVLQVLLKIVRDNNPTMVPYAVDALRDLGYPFPEDKSVTVDVPSNGVAPRPEGRPANIGPGTTDVQPGVSVPGKRSQDKQTSPPPAPPRSGDGSRNS